MKQEQQIGSVPEFPEFPITKKRQDSLLAAFKNARGSSVDDCPRVVREVRHFVLDQHELCSGMIDACLVDLLLAFYPLKRRSDARRCAAKLQEQVSRLSFRTKLELLTPSMEAIGKDWCVRRLKWLSQLRNDFAHRSFRWAGAKYGGTPLWRVPTLRRLVRDCFLLGLELSGYVFGIDEAKKVLEAQVKSLDLRRFWQPT